MRQDGCRGVRSRSRYFLSSPLIEGEGVIRWPWKRTKAASSQSQEPSVCAEEQATSRDEFPVLAAGPLLERTGAGRVVEVLRVKLGFPRALFDGGVLPLVHSYAEFVQLLPALTPRRGEEAGGLLLHGLEAASSALDFRRGKILPRGASPEVIGELHHRWTYAVFIAALLHHIERPVCERRVLMRQAGREPESWLPFAGALSTREALSYRWEMAALPVDETARGKLALFMFDRFVPIGMIEWLSADADLMRELLCHLGGEPAAERSALHELAARGAAHAAGIEWRPMVSPVSPSASASSVSAPVPDKSPAGDSGADFDQDFLDPVDDPLPAPRRRKVR